MRKILCSIAIVTALFGTAWKQKAGETQKSKLLHANQATVTRGPCQITTLQGKVALQDPRCIAPNSNKKYLSSFRFQKLQCDKVSLGFARVSTSTKWTRGTTWQCIPKHQHTYKLLGYTKRFVSIQHNSTNNPKGSPSQTLATYNRQTGLQVTLQALLPQRHRAVRRRIEALKKQKFIAFKRFGFRGFGGVKYIVVRHHQASIHLKVPGFAASQKLSKRSQKKLKKALERTSQEFGKSLGQGIGNAMGPMLSLALNLLISLAILWTVSLYFTFRNMRSLGHPRKGLLLGLLLGPLGWLFSYVQTQQKKGKKRAKKVHES